MKKIFLALMVGAAASLCAFSLAEATGRARQKLEMGRADWGAQTQELARIQEESSELATRIRNLEGEAGIHGPAAPMDPTLTGLMLGGDLQSADLDTQERLLAELGRGRNSSANYVLVAKAALTNATLQPLKRYPNGGKLSDAARAVLAITPEEERTVESAFADAMGAVAAWAKANVQREGSSNDLVVRYTIPVDPAFEEALTNRLFSNLNAAIGSERGELMSKFFLNWRFFEDGAIGERTNVFSIHRLSGQPGLGYRAGWEWSDGPRQSSSTVNTFPEPIKPGNFPHSFQFVFPGGWQEVAQREGFELPEEFPKN